MARVTPIDQRPATKGWLAILGPGLLAGASDDDPSGIATYSQAGAQFGNALGWTMIFSYPLMCAIQEISARIGRVTGIGIAGNLRRHYASWALVMMVALVVVANIINLGADLGAMGAALGLLVGGPQWLYVVVFGVASAVLEVLVSYRRYAGFLKWLTLSLFAYVATAFVVHVPWGATLLALAVPRFTVDANSITDIVAVLGTTISPYLFFWQAGLEVEDEQSDRRAKPLRRAPEQAPREFHRIRIDTLIGMGLSNLIGLFIIISTAATLHAHGVTDIATSAQAAEALRPIAGPFAFVVFAAGIIGTGLLAIPVLAGSAAYALGEALSWRVGLRHLPGRARRFYAAITIATLLGIGVNFSPLDPMKALFWSAVINGMIGMPIMVMMMLMAAKPAVMGEFVLQPMLKGLGWLCTAVMGVTVAVMIATWLV